MREFRVKARLLEFLFMRRALVEAASRAEAPNSVCMSLLRSARSLLGAAGDLAEGAEWQVASLILLREAGVAAATGLVSRSERGQTPTDPAAIWSKACELPSVQAALRSASPLTRERLTLVVGSGILPGYTAWSEEDRGHLLEPVRRAVQQLVVILEEEVFTSQRLRGKLALRWICLLAAVSLMLAAVAYQLLRIGNVNHALNASVTTSSTYLPEVYDPKGLVDGDKTHIGCHTLSGSEPWAIIDLGAQTRISRIVVTNRLDVHAEAAVPLVIEVSPNGVDYVEFAQQSTVFTTWTARGETTTARYVRLSIPRPSVMHLNEVEVY